MWMLLFCVCVFLLLWLWMCVCYVHHVKQRDAIAHLKIYWNESLKNTHRSATLDLPEILVSVFCFVLFFSPTFKICALLTHTHAPLNENKVTTKSTKCIHTPVFLCDGAHQRCFLKGNLLQSRIPFPLPFWCMR